MSSTTARVTKMTVNTAATDDAGVSAPKDVDSFEVVVDDKNRVLRVVKKHSHRSHGTWRVKLTTLQLVMISGS
jgi:hypothetical protein